MRGRGRRVGGTGVGWGGGGGGAEGGATSSVGVCVSPLAALWCRTVSHSMCPLLVPGRCSCEALSLA